jgi:protein O-GlcNAc transferase
MATAELWEEALRSHESGDTHHAQAIYEEIIRENPLDARAHYLLGKISESIGASEVAITKFAQAAAMAPEWFEPARDLVRAYVSREQFHAADRVLSQLGPRYAADARFHVLASEVLTEIGDNTAAIRAAEVATGCANASGETHINLGNVARRVSDFPRALIAYQRAAASEATRTAALVNAAGVYQLQKNLPDALKCYENVPSAEQEKGDWVFSYAEVLRQLGQWDKWAALASNFSVTHANSCAGLRIRAEVALYRGDLADAQRLQEAASHALKETDLGVADELSFLRLHFDNTEQSHKKFYQAMDQSWQQEMARASISAQKLDVAHQLVNNRALRVGYISPDMRDHVMGRMASAMIENRDRSSHRSYIYSLTASEDHLTAQFAKNAELFARCANASDDAIAARIMADKIDILVDLSGPTAGARPGVLARKPAPVIITHIGAAGPAGLSAIDYKLTDAICDLPENQDYLIEKLLPMTGCCYPVPKYPLPTHGVSKADLHLDKNVTIGAFYTYMKLSERCVKLWKRVLDEIPTGVLLFSPLDPKLQVAYENIMRSAEIPPTKFRFLVAGATEAERLARYRVVDFVLDSMPYGGVNGTLEALYMGVPVVTLTGKHHSERTTTSMLTHLGVTDTIAATPDEYVAHAKRLATDSDWRSDISTRIRARWPKFADPVDYARRWEALLRKVAK